MTQIRLVGLDAAEDDLQKTREVLVSKSGHLVFLC